MYQRIKPREDNFNTKKWQTIKWLTMKKKNNDWTEQLIQPSDKFIAEDLNLFILDLFLTNF